MVHVLLQGSCTETIAIDNGWACFGVSDAASKLLIYTNSLGVNSPKYKPLLRQLIQQLQAAALEGSPL